MCCLTFVFIYGIRVEDYCCSFERENYPTWKIQCRMALMKEGLWNIVDGTEAAPGRDIQMHLHLLQWY